MATTGQNQHFKVNRMPEEILFQPFPSLNPRQFFRPMMPAYEFVISRKNLMDKISSMSKIFEKSISDHGRDSDKVDLIEKFERQAIECVKNNCTSDFLNDHGREMAVFETVKDAFIFFESIFGAESEEEKRERAMDELESLTRRSEKNEKFAMFLKRIQSIATVITDKSDARNFIVDQHFAKNLEPCNKAFLRDHGYSKKSTDEIVAFLDSRDRFLSANISAIQSTDFAAFFADKTSELLDNKFAKMEANYEKKSTELTDTIKTLTATVARLEADNKKANSADNSNRQERQNFQNSQPAFSPQFQGYSGNRHGFQPNNQASQRVPFCFNCNTQGHFKSICPKIQCYECKNFGHIGRNCSRRQNNRPVTSAPQWPQIPDQIAAPKNR
jgi:hypothetical protein